MEDYDDVPQEMNPMKVPDIEKYTGAIWRKPTEEEMDEVAQYYAESDVNADKRFFNLEMDQIEYLIAVKKRKEEIIQKTNALALAMDFVNLNVQVFYTFHFSFAASKNSKMISFEDGMAKLVRNNGNFSEMEDMYETLFNV